MIVIVCVASWQVGAATETELKDKKLRYEDALNSVRSAIELGIVPGGGACLQFLQRMGEHGHTDRPLLHQSHQYARSR